MIKNITAFLALSMILFSAKAIEKTTYPKSEGWCNTEIPDDNWENAFQRQIANFKLNEMQNRLSNVPISIPVIVHVIYWNNNNQQNIVKAQVDSQIAVLNRNFNGKSQFVNNVPNVFKPLIANLDITFCPAKMGINGNVLAEPGIDRVSAQTAGFTNPGAGSFINPYKWDATYIDGTIKPATIWNPDYYCNIWVVPGIAGGVVGYATFPTGTGLTGIFGGSATPTTDGVVIWSVAYGKGGSTINPYQYGGTTTHELGHWMGLRHIGGDTICGNDFVNDTPTQAGGNSGGLRGQNYGCPSYPYHVNGCSGSTGANGELFMNYMDYTDDNCTNMFSNDQKTRMLTTMSLGDRRAALTTSTTCDTVKPAPIASFNSTQTPLTPCIANATFNFTDKSAFGPTTWSWTFAGGTPASSNAQNVNGVVFTTPGLHSVTLTVTSPKGTSTITKQVNAIITGNGSMPFSENFEGAAFPPANWSFKKRNPDPNVNWEARDGSSGFGIGNRCMIFDNTSLDALGFDDDIMTPKLNLTGINASTLKFDIAYAPYFSGSTSIYDTLEVYLTDNCGSSYTKIYTKGGTALATFLPGIGEEFYPTAGQWRTDSVVVPAGFLNKPNVQVVFRNLGNFGHTIYVDNVNLSSPSAAPQASFTWSDTAVCKGATLTFNNTSTGSPDSVRWTINGGTPSTSTSTGSVTPTFNTAGTFVTSLTVYKGGVPSSPFTRSILVKSLPAVNAGTNQTICAGASATLTATGATTYQWTGGPASATYTVTPSGTTDYIVTGTTLLCTAKDTVKVIVNPKPNVNVNSPTICAGFPATLNATGASTYTWSGGLASGASTTTPTLNTTTNYNVYGVDANGCKDTAVAVVTVNPKPTVSAGSGATICAGNSTTLTATGASTYQWTGGPATAAYTVSPTITTTYTVTGTNGNGCTNTATVTVTVTTTNPTVSITTSTGNTTICSGQSITLTGNGAGTYVWTGGPSTAAYTVSPTNSTTYTVTGTVTGCPSLFDDATVTITVNPLPTVGANSATICNGQSAVLTANGATSYQWTGGPATAAYTVSPSSTTTYTVTGTTSGCSGSTTSTVTVNSLPASGTITQRNDTIFTSGSGVSYNWYRGGIFLSSTATPYLKITQSGSYQVEVVAANTCVSLKSTSFGATVTGIRTNTLNIQYNIIPNPNNGEFEVRIVSNKTAKYSLVLYNVTGQEMMREELNINNGINSKRYNFSRLESGVYFLSLMGAEGISTQNLIIE